LQPVIPPFPNGQPLPQPERLLSFFHFVQKLASGSATKVAAGSNPWRIY